MSDNRQDLDQLRHAGDAELLHAWHEGDDRAGEVLFDRHYDAVARFFRNKVVEHDDLVQRTFAICVESSRRFREDSKFRTYLLGIAKNVLFKHYRAQSSTRDQDSLDELSVEAMGQTPSELLSGRDEERLLLAALRRLPVPLQVLIELRYWEDLKHREIADVLGVPEGTVKTRIRQGKRQLEEALAALADSPQTLRETITRLDQWAEQLRRNLATRESELR